MAYITKTEVAAKNEALKPIAKKWGIKARFSGSNSSTLKCKISAGKLDFIGNCISVMQQDAWKDFRAEERISSIKKSQAVDVNPYWFQEHYTGEVLQCLQDIMAVMKIGHFDKSDAMIDYFNCSWYNSIAIGEWNKPYQLTK